MTPWSQFQNDFDAMSDKDVDDKTRSMADQLDEAEEWLEAVAEWRSAGRPRKAGESA